jgi:hypothetical protein
MGCSAVLRRSAAGRSGFRLVLALGLLVAAAGSAPAVDCGDNVGGTRIACACGDQVVSDTILSSVDPVTAEPCQGDGLVISVPRHSAGITLDLNGLSLVGSGSGVGIRVVRGGSVGSRIIGGEPGGAMGEISNFRTGISGSGRNVLVEVSNVHVHDNVGDGLRIHSSGVLVENVLSEENGRDGLSVLGHGNEVSGVVADRNNSDGVQVRGQGSSVSADANGNLRHGLVVAGRGNRVDDSTTSNNGGVGIATSGKDLEVGQIDIIGNREGDMKDRAGAISGAPR